MTTFAIDIGHNCPPDTGANGIRREDDLTLAVGERVIARLTAMGHECIRTKPSCAKSVNESLHLRCGLANINNVDVVCSIHFNASRGGRGRGTETYYISPRGKYFAEAINNELVKLGFRDRGAKYGTWYLLKNTKAPAILVEVAFCDNAGDMALVDQVGLDSIANGIVAGLII
jgi:N-acetylmuramoyl-L-alanine amidase